MDKVLNSQVGRRRFVAGAGFLATTLSGASITAAQGASDASPSASPVAIDLLQELVIDLAGDPVSIDPAFAYSARDWSIVHSIYDGLIAVAEDGTIRPLAAERFEAVDELTFEAKLREGMVFHDGSPVTADAAIRGIEHLQASEDSQVSALFNSIIEMKRVDDLTVQIHCDAPSPWLPAQMAVWHMLLPEGYTAESLSSSPVGSGPYRFVSWEKGSRVDLERFVDYQPADVKGAPIADRVVYRFVPEASTRVADLASGSADIAVDIPLDQHDAVESGDATVVSEPIVGAAWIRIATDTEPFNDVRVRRALNMALDVDAIAQVFISEQAHRLASLHPDKRSMGFNPELEPYAYDRAAAIRLLEEAGYADGFDVVFEVTTAVPQAMAEAMVAQWADVGIRAEIKVSELAEFNAAWGDPSAPPLRMSTWSPLYDPYTLLSLVFASEGYLSRYDNPEADELIASAAIEIDPEKRAALYRDLAVVMHDDAPAVFLWNLVASHGVTEAASAWDPRGDQYVLPLTR
jgi:peptide/nickel transport system substrate-binding protein